jgi:hypothetical protein
MEYTVSHEYVPRMQLQSTGQVNRQVIDALPDERIIECAIGDLLFRYGMGRTAHRDVDWRELRATAD